MKILINTSSNFKGGGIQVAKSFIEECKKFNENEYYVVLSKNMVKVIDKSKFASNFFFYDAPFRPATKFFSLYSHNSFLKKIENKFRPDIVFTTSGPSYWRPKKLHIMGYNIPHYIYPESPYFNKIKLLNRVLWKLRKKFAIYFFNRDGDVFVVQTDDVNKRLKNIMPSKKIFTVTNTVNSYYVNQLKRPFKLPPCINNEFRLLTLSAWYPHKNLDIIPKVIDLLIQRGYPNIKFIVTLNKDDMNLLSSDKNYEQLINVGPVKIEDGASLYQECHAMFLPSLIECFSASYAEAMHTKKPIITSDMGFAHTVCKDAALYFDPVDEKDIASKIIKLYKSKSLQNKLIQNGSIILESFGSSFLRAKNFLEICKVSLK